MCWAEMFSALLKSKAWTEIPCDVMVKAQDCGVVISEFELLWRDYVNFPTNILGERYETPYPPGYKLINTTIVLLDG